MTAIAVLTSSSPPLIKITPEVALPIRQGVSRVCRSRRPIPRGMRLTSTMA